MLEPETGRDVACIMDIDTGAACALAADRFTMVIKLKRNADNIKTGFMQQCSGDRGIDATGHGDNNAGIGGGGIKAKGVQPG